MRINQHYVVCMVVAFVLTGAVFATAMGFKVVYSLSDDGTGQNKMGLPYIPRTGLDDAEDLINDINDQAGSNVVASVSRHLSATDTPEVYNGITGVPFSLTPGEGYTVVMTDSADYSIIGTHDPSLSLTLLGPEDSLSGMNVITIPYHTTAMYAEDLINDIEGQAGDGVVASVARLITATDTTEIYNGIVGPNFPVKIGEAYMVVVTETAQYVPSHY